MQVGNHQYSIHVVKYMPRKGTMGVTYYDKKHIAVATKCGVTQRKYSAAEFNDTFWHELTHAVLFEMGSPLHTDERFVTAFSSRLSHAINTAEFK